ncbi:hypothetical protein CR194_13275 [Salipaludibacillus keqinensis]|uniref:DUF2071 domain-containing protein n=1 Tax=Salipaludibacillus keqinensis TaxID=2045207 RepID=A0A323TT57_9BACI|nr:DUF2071 domain-containing protein [Salipaludibacillus keqinensis]PYZ92635.1 hypothetical protein CR194_13275 [Salipaludibacillus keqinensis]
MKRFWIGRQDWDHTFFVHYRIPTELLHLHVPDELTIEEFDGSAWISIVAFEANDNVLRLASGLSVLPSFLELDVRTYVKYKGERGMIFLTMDANSLTAIKGARWLTSLPYYESYMNIRTHKEGCDFTSIRKGKKKDRAVFTGSTSSQSESYPAVQDPITEFLMERYALFTTIKGDIYRGPIEHAGWEVMDAEIEIFNNSLFDFISGFEPSEPIVHLAKSQRTAFHPFEPVQQSQSTD